MKTTFFQFFAILTLASLISELPLPIDIADDN